MVDVDFLTTPSEWKTTSVSSYGGVDFMMVSNDIVSEILFGTSDDPGISVMTSNFLKDDLPKFNYILKRYSSGLAELYILVDTTNTYYINHVPGAGYPNPATDEFPRSNLNGFQDNSIIDYDQESEGGTFFQKYKTQISVVID
jgi:hypothetical protein